MAYKDILELRDVSNTELMNAIRNDASLDYQARIPEVTQANMKVVVDNLTEYRPAWNEFLNGFINRIGSIYARTESWTNPLAVFKKGMMTYGDTVEEYMTGLLEAHSYDPDRNYGEQILFGQERPHVEVNYHRVNRQDMYKATINDKMLRRAFISEDGLSKLIGQLMEAPLKSDQWDEFLLMSNLFAKNEANGGFFKVHVPDFTNLEGEQGEARAALKTLRSLAYRLPFLSTQYNAAGMPASARPEDLMLIGTPEFLASIDVDGLAPIFHMDKADIIRKRTVALPQEHMKIKGAQGVLTTTDFFMVFDTLIENRSQPNPAGLYENFFLHHHQIVSLSRFVPAILLTSDSGTVTVREDYTVNSVAAPTVKDSDGQTVTTVTRGDIYDLDAAVTTTPLGGNVGVAFSLSGAKSSKTYITSQGVLYVSPTETATSLTIHAHTVNISANNPRLDPKTNSATVNVTGEILGTWPAGGELYGIKVAGVNVLSVNPSTLTYNLNLPAGTVVEGDDVYVSTKGSPDVEIQIEALESPANGYKITISVDSGAGAAKVYTVTANVPAA